MTHYELSEKIADLMAEAKAELDAYHYGTAAKLLHKASELLDSMQRRGHRQQIDKTVVRTEGVSGHVGYTLGNHDA